MNAPRLIAISVVATGLLLAAAACGDDKSKSEPKPLTFDAHGRVVLTIEIMGDDVEALDAYCEEQFAAIVGTQVPLANPVGRVVGYGVVSQPTLDLETGTCEADWTAEEVPETQEVLSYQLGTYEPIFFKQDEAEDLVLNVRDEGAGHQVG